MSSICDALTCCFRGLVLAALCAGTCHADIIYTWHEDDGQNVTGQLVVKSSVLAAGKIEESDIISFSFQGTFPGDPAVDPNATPFSHVLADFDFGNSLFPIAISTATAIPTQNAGEEFRFNDSVTVSFDGIATLDFDSNLTTASSQKWNRSTSGLQIDQNGAGHWSVSGLTVPAVPEPSSMILSGLGAVGLVIRGLRRGRKANRNQKLHFAGND